MQVRRLFQIVNGGTPSSDQGNWGGEVTWVTPDDLGKSDGIRIATSARTLTMAGLRASANLVPRGTIVLSTRAPIGHIAIADVRLAFNQGCKGLVPRQDLDERFFYYQLIAMRPELQVAGQGVTFPELSGVRLGAMRLACPSLGEQRRIADFLERETGRIDEALRLKRELFDRLSDRVAAVMHEAVAGLPRNARLAYVVVWRSGGTPPKAEPSHWWGDLPWASTKDLIQDELNDTVDHITEDAAAAHSTVVPPGTVLVATRGMALAKRLPLAVASRRMAFNQDLKALIPSPAVESGYLRVVLRGLESEILANVVEAAHGTRRLETRWLKALRVPVPDLRLQRSTVERVQAIETQNDAVASRLERQMSLLIERRQALITNAVSGELDTTSYPASC
ncbi:MAG: type restriction enzyme subunit [Solirubrobacteraceae bacterium]|jgi:type I restriction enzyme S subunit|nr:type restriction enzyme subunit [Solirubrobacteraceae bacterium]